MPRYWLMKSEPAEVSIDDLAARAGQTLPWTGVRNYQARNFMRDEMRIGDGVLFYHSSCAEPGMAGLARSRRHAVPDATQFDPASPYFDPKATPDAAALAADRRGAGAQDAAAAAARDARRARAGHDARAAAAATGCRSRRSRPTEWQRRAARLLARADAGPRPVRWSPNCWRWALCTGFLAGLLGIGGGMMMVPFLTLILSQRGVPAGMAVKMAIATSMATILFTSLSSVRAHHRRGAVRWDLVRGIAPGIVVGGLLAGAGVFALLKGQRLALVVRRCSSASRRCRCCATASPRPSRQMPGLPGQTGAGRAASASLSGLVGAGGAFISVPFMTWCNVPMHQAVATSAALGFPIALASTAGLPDQRLEPAAAPCPAPSATCTCRRWLIVALASVTHGAAGRARGARASTCAQLKRAVRAAAVRPGGYMLYRACAPERRSAGSAGSKRMLASVTWLPPRRCASASAPSQAASRSSCDVRGVREAGHAHRHA